MSHYIPIFEPFPETERCSRGKKIFWIRELPLELLFKVLTLLCREDLESLITLLDIDFTGIVQYAVDGPFTIKSDKLRTVPLEDLDHNEQKSMINIVIIKKLNDLNIEEARRRLTGSFNLLTVSNVEIDADYSFSILEKLLSTDFPSNGVTQVTDSEKLTMRHRDVSLLSFKNIHELTLTRCRLSGQFRQFFTSRVRRLYLFRCSGNALDNGYKETEDKEDIKCHGMVLRRLYINAKELSVRSCYVKSLTFNGLTLSLSYGVYDTWLVTICNLKAPRLKKLCIKFYNSFPIFTNAFFPRLKIVQLWKDWESLDGPLFDQQLDNNNNYHFLKGIEVLHLEYFYEPLHKVNFTELKALFLTLDRNIETVKPKFPCLERLSVHLYTQANRLPTLRAYNLRCLYFYANSEFQSNTIAHTIRSYPRLRQFWYRGSSFNDLELPSFRNAVRSAFRSSPYKHKVDIRNRYPPR